MKSSTVKPKIGIFKIFKFVILDSSFTLYQYAYGSTKGKWLNEMTCWLDYTNSKIDLL